MDTFLSILTVVGFAINIIGLRFTWLELERTKTASEVSNKLLKSVGERMSHNYLLVLLPQLRLMADDLDSAVIAVDLQSARRALVGYSRAANQVAFLLTSGVDLHGADLAERLQKSAIDASATKSRLMKGTTKPIRVVVAKISKEMEELASITSGLLIAYQAKVGQ